MTEKELRDRIIELLSTIQGNAVPQSFIHKSLTASKSRVSEILAELEREGLIRRRQVGRSKIVYVPSGISEIERSGEKKKISLGIVYSSEYLFLGYFLKRLKEAGLEIEVKVFSDGIEATDSLAHGSIDLSISPFVGQLLMFPLFESYTIIAKGMGKGYNIMYKEGGEAVHSSKMSTMDYIRSVALKRGIIYSDTISYYSSIDELLRKAHEKKGYVVTWHPIFRFLEKMGFRRIDFEGIVKNELCCSLGISNILGNKMKDKIAELYVKSLEDYLGKKDKYIETYSAITGIEVPLLKDAIKEYEVFEGEGRNAAIEVLENISTSIPHKSEFLKALSSI